MGAAVLQREQFTVGASDHRHRFTSVMTGQHLAGLDLFRPGNRVPVVGVTVHAPQIDAAWQLADRADRIKRHTGFPSGNLHGPCRDIGALPQEVQERGKARRAGTKTNVASSVQPRLIKRSSPMLAVPGCRDSASEPNAVAVVRAENKTARAVAELSGSLSAASQFMTK